jgi:Radical SAM superfamily
MAEIRPIDAPAAAPSSSAVQDGEAENKQVADFAVAAVDQSGAPPSATFCVQPWIHLFADEKGELYPCCRVVGTRRPNVDESGKPHRMDDPRGLERAWNSGYMTRLRTSMLRGKRPSECHLCFDREDLGITTHRQSQNHHYRAIIPQLVAETDEQGRVPLNLREVDIRLGNRCNLRCRMCHPFASKGLIGEFAALHGVEPTAGWLGEAQQLDWFSRPSFWKIFERYVPDVERVHFGGGEPLLIPEMFEFLERLIDLGRSNSIIVSYNTNMTVLPPRVFELWERFKKVRITVSLDGFDTVNSFIRHPADWSEIDRNLRTLDAQADRLGGGILSFNTTVQIYNVLRLSDLFAYTFETFERFQPYPNLSLLEMPSQYSIQVLTKPLKRLAAERLDEFRHSYEGRWPSRVDSEALRQFLANIDGLISHMNQLDRSSEIAAFGERNNFQDRFRNQDVTLVIPELLPMFDVEHTPLIQIPLPVLPADLPRPL